MKKQNINDGFKIAIDSDFSELFDRWVHQMSVIFHGTITANEKPSINGLK